MKHNAITVKMSIIIITYNRPDDMLDLARNISEQLDVSLLLDEIIILNNNSSENYSELEEFIKTSPNIPFRYIKSTENLGVSRGRNYAAKQSQSPILIFIDDDALFQNKDALQNILQIFTQEHQNNDRPLGTLCFKVLYESTLDLQKTAFPHKQFSKRKDLHSFETPYFVGCGHAILKDVFDRTGYYPENFFYGMEEYDLSYRILANGFSIRYEDKVCILHKESPLGRIPSNEKLMSQWVNKSKIAWKYLPKKYFYSTAFLWSLYYLKKSNFHFKGWISGWKKIFKIYKSETRACLSKLTLLYLDKINARLLY